MNLAEADRLIDATLSTIRGAEAQAWAIVSHRLGIGVTLSPDEWAQRKANELSRLRRELERIVKRLQKDATVPVLTLVEAAYRTGHETASDVLGAAAFSTISRRRVEALAAETIGIVGQIGPAILRETVDVYRTVVAQASGGLLTGTRTLAGAVDDALRGFATKGLSGFTDSAGRNWTLDAYADMALRSTAVRSQVAGTLDRARQSGSGLVIVSDSPEECPLCRPYERKVLAVEPDGKHTTVEQAQAAGLFHPNCTHTIQPYVEGLTVKGRAKSNPDGYEDRQRQRYLERNIRSWQRREIAAVSPEEAAKARRKLREWQTAHRKFLDDTGRRRSRRASIPRPERERLTRS